ncbi:MAG: 6-bladed beta-propeller [SAR202 cluster bacterium]|nr:6-bladed beta-propeller [SAR202 cluster bacterium]
MSRPYALLRAGFPYYKTIGARGRTILPNDMTIAPDGTIYTLCQGTNYGKGNPGPIYITNLEDEYIGSMAWRNAQYGPYGHCQFHWPCQIVIDGKNRLFCSDQAFDYLQVFNRDAEYLGRFGEAGTGPGQFNRPSGLAVDAQDNLYVVDSLNHRIQKFDKNGRFVSMFGSLGSEPGQFNMPWGTHVDSEHDEIYVADWRNDRVQVFDMNWEFQFQFGESGSGKGQLNRPMGIAVDKDGDIYVCDWGNNRVQLFDKTGRYIQQFLGDATLSRQEIEVYLRRHSAKQNRLRIEADNEQEKLFAGPRSVRVDSEGHMFVVEADHYRIQVYKKQAIVLTEMDVAPPLKVPTMNQN